MAVRHDLIYSQYWEKWPVGEQPFYTQKTSLVCEIIKRIRMQMMTEESSSEGKSENEWRGKGEREGPLYMTALFTICVELEIFFQLSDFIFHKERKYNHLTLNSFLHRFSLLTRFPVFKSGEKKLLGKSYYSSPFSLQPLTLLSFSFFSHTKNPLSTMTTKTRNKWIQRHT